MIKIPVIVTEDYTVYTEQVESFTFIHCDVYRWAKTVAKNLYRDLDSFQGYLKDDLYALKVNEKLGKFMKLYGFEMLTEIETKQGLKEIYWREYYG